MKKIKNENFEEWKINTSLYIPTNDLEKVVKFALSQKSKHAFRRYRKQTLIEDVCTLSRIFVIDALKDTSILSKRLNMLKHLAKQDFLLSSNSKFPHDIYYILGHAYTERDFEELYFPDSNPTLNFYKCAKIHRRFLWNCYLILKNNYALSHRGWLKQKGYIIHDITTDSYLVQHPFAHACLTHEWYFILDVMKEIEYQLYHGDKQVKNHFMFNSLIVVDNDWRILKAIDGMILTTCMDTITFNNLCAPQILDYVCKHLSQYTNYEKWLHSPQKDFSTIFEDDDPGYSLLHNTAYYSDCTKCLYPLLRYTKNKDPCTLSGRSLLSVAISNADDKNEHYDAVNVLLKINPTINVNNYRNQDKHVVYACIYSRKFHQFNRLLDLGMDLSHIAVDNWKFMKQKLKSIKKKKQVYLEDILSHIKDDYITVIQQSTPLLKDIVMHELLPFLINDCVLKDVMKLS